MDSNSNLEPESKLLSLIYQLIFVGDTPDSDFSWDWDSNALSLVVQIISLVSSMDLDSQLKPELKLLISQTISVFKSLDLDSENPLSKIISLVKATISLFKSLDLYREPKPLLELLSLIIEEDSLLNSVGSDWEFGPDKKFSLWDTFGLRFKPNPELRFLELASQTFELEPEPELMSLIHQIVFMAFFMNTKWPRRISLCPQVQVRFEKGKFRVTGKVERGNKWECLPTNWQKFKLAGEEYTHFLCNGCKGENHEEFEKVPAVIKQPLHPKHSLHLVLLSPRETDTRKCYCCDDDLMRLFYYCSACDFGMNLVCLEKRPALSIDHPKWHEHTLVHFPRQLSLTCDMCALVDSSSPMYICVPCDFFVHQRCLSLPHVIKISRHFHRISFTHSSDHHSIDQIDLTCGVCRRKIDDNYGRYSCIKDGCSYAAHARCATQSNVWDGVDLEGVPEEPEEEPEPPFVRISDGIIRHFAHQHHHLILDEDTKREYDEKKQCYACLTPIYFGNFYSCMECDFILHEECANLSRKIHHPIHPHLLTLVGGHDGVLDYRESLCSACPWICKNGFFYECGKEGCEFQLNVQCATIAEPLFHESHIDPLFLTSKPGEVKECSVCKEPSRSHTNEKFNCIECDFSLCFACATLPHKVRYKHDKHTLTLSYEKEVPWCEACECKIYEGTFYRCNEYCCTSLHIDCLIGRNLYIKAGSSYKHTGRSVSILPNHLMSRPVCYYCEVRCEQKIIFRSSAGMIYCSIVCYDYWSQ